MKTNGFLLAAVACVATGLFAAHRVHAGSHCRRADPCRGIAILSPLESPDCCDSPVGGCYRYTPYYPGYSPDRRCLVLYGQTNWAYSGPSSPASGNRPADYGALTGASRDEATLLRLGGNGSAPRGTYNPSSRTSGDLIDRIHGFGR
jgi:hypothetical protein